MKSLKVIPAYGRDYNSKAEIEKDWNNNLDFIINDMFNPYDGKPVNKEDAVKVGFTSLTVRYKELRKVATFKILWH